VAQPAEADDVSRLSSPLSRGRDSAARGHSRPGVKKIAAGLYAPPAKGPELGLMTAGTARTGRGARDGDADATTIRRGPLKVTQP